MKQLKRAKELLLERRPKGYQKEIEELELVLINNADGLFPLSSSLNWVHNKELIELFHPMMIDITSLKEWAEFNNCGTSL